ncbi:MAG: signal peptidase I, partial [Paracoccaceae bacterium]
PGDRVQVKNGLLYINDKPVHVVPAGVFDEIYEAQGPQGGTPVCANGYPGRGEKCSKARYRETLPNGIVHNILNIENGGRADNTKIFTVPKGQFFFMGDNRDNSSDSRFARPRGVGFVPFENLVGRADRIMFSSAGRSILYFWTWRSDRFFKAIE